MLVEYCGNESESLSRLPQFKENPKIQALLVVSNEGESWHLSDLTSLISSRICEYYPSIINELSQGLEPSHLDAEGLPLVLGLLNEMKSEIEKRNLDFQIRAKTEQILQKMDMSHFKSNLVPFSFRSFLC